MKNEIHNRKPAFGDLEQIEWLKRQARLKEASDAGSIDFVLEQVPVGDPDDEQSVIRLKCPGCLVGHHFSVTSQDAIVYEASCGTRFDYKDKQLQVNLQLDSSDSPEDATYWFFRRRRVLGSGL